ncbi:alpha/beta hydrolase [Methyloterricola oryzae]|uniref:alpha/beta hydrolase n=1 Tax=Methyloterricola oryzae TaxID=1495050 RepID=UPI0005EB60FD|nr:alpha/beta hydrolase fold domain-containing protein [Methyloterricola oryzae]
MVIKLPLWPQGAPQANGLSGPERSGKCAGNITQPTLTAYLPPANKATGAAIVLLSGGSYQVVCIEMEAEKIAALLVPRGIAALLVPRGIAAIVVKYRIPNQHATIPADDARQALRVVRQRAAEWNINPQRVGVWGFSAGGHLASTLSTAFDAGQPAATDPIERQSSRPDFSILFYPVISMDEGVTHGPSRRNLLGPTPAPELIARYSNDQQVSAQTPPTFLLHAGDDTVVPVENSLQYYRQLVKHQVPARLVVYETGGHGPTVFQDNPSWLGVLEDWLRHQQALAGPGAITARAD